MRRRQLPFALAAVAAALPAQAGVPPPEVAAAWAAARRVGQARLRFMGLHVYDAQLWAPEPPTPDDWAQRDFALELVYARSFEGGRIAERSLAEMRRQGPIEPDRAERWLSTMRETFPDVRAGDRLTGLHRGAQAQFHHNGAPRARWDDAALVRAFFGIWLAPQTSEPAMRGALFGGRA